MTEAALQLQREFSDRPLRLESGQVRPLFTITNPAGGTLVVEKQEVPGMGTFSLFTDPDGRMLGIWKRAE